MKKKRKKRRNKKRKNPVNKSKKSTQSLASKNDMDFLNNLIKENETEEKIQKEKKEKKKIAKELYFNAKEIGAKAEAIPAALKKLYQALNNGYRCQLILTALGTMNPDGLINCIKEKNGFYLKLKNATKRDNVAQKFLNSLESLLLKTDNDPYYLISNKEAEDNYFNCIDFYGDMYGHEDFAMNFLKWYQAILKKAPKSYKFDTTKTKKELEIQLNKKQNKNYIKDNFAVLQKKLKKNNTKYCYKSWLEKEKSNNSGCLRIKFFKSDDKEPALLMKKTCTNKYRTLLELYVDWYLAETGLVEIIKNHSVVGFQKLKPNTLTFLNNKTSELSNYFQIIDEENVTIDFDFDKLFYDLVTNIPEDNKELESYYYDSEIDFIKTMLFAIKKDVNNNGADFLKGIKLS